MEESSEKYFNQQLDRITEKIRQSSDIDGLLKTTLEGICSALDLSSASIKIDTKILMNQPEKQDIQS